LGAEGLEAERGVQAVGTRGVRGVDAELGEVDPVRALSTHRRGEERLRDSPTAPCPYGPEQVDVARGVPRDLPVVLVLLDPDVTRDASRALLARDEAPP